MYYEHPDSLRAEANAHIDSLIAEAAEARLAAQAEAATAPLVQIREDLAAWLQPRRRRVAIKGI
jgi:hypothetical protein